jgi:hypothetical protein
MSQSTLLPSEESSFALRFQGFANDLPDAEQRFQAFCVANLHLSAEETGRILAQPGVAVICRRGSSHDLASLAGAFRELGALVSIIDPRTEFSLSSSLPDEALSEISPQLEELLRAPSLGVIESSCSSGEYVVTLNESIKVNTSSEMSQLRTMMREHGRQNPGSRGPYDHSALQHVTTPHPIAPKTRSRRSRSIRTRPHSRRRVGLTGIQMIGVLIAGLACFIAIDRAFIGKPDLRAASAGGSWGVTDSDVWSKAVAPAAARHFDGTVRRQGYTLTISTRMQDDSVSARVLMVTPMYTQPSSGKPGVVPQLRRAEGDITLLREIEPGVWGGRLVTYLFIEHQGQIQRVPAQTEISVQSAPDNLTAQASIELVGLLPSTLHEIEDVPGFSHTLIDGEHSLKVRDHVPLASSVSF